MYNDRGYFNPFNMKTFLIAGIIYLIIVFATLYVRPELMFTESGDWKEFGIGRDSSKYTWMPFWLFTILLAIMTYATCTMFIEEESGYTHSKHFIKTHTSSSASKMFDEDDVDFEEPKIIKQRQSKPKSKQVDMKPGYYILNEEATKKTGFPKYIYLGPQEPEIEME